MLKAGLWSRARKAAPHRTRRKRKAHFGELVQLDGSVHRWYETRAPQGCLMTLVDDAPSRTGGRLGEHETIWAAVAVLRRWIETYGVPHALYTDWKNETRCLQLDRHSGLPPARSTVLVREDPTGALEIRYRGRVMPWTEIAAPVAAPAPPVRPRLSSAPHRPARPNADHPWRRDTRVADAARARLRAESA